MLTLHTLRSLSRRIRPRMSRRALSAGAIIPALCAVPLLLSACGAPTLPEDQSVPLASISTPEDVATPVAPVETSVPTSVYAPVISPPDEPATGPTITALIALTVIPVPTQIPGLQETMVARATVSPLPSAEPPAVKTGSPSVATGRRAGIAIELHLDSDSFLGGENGRARIVMRNDSSQMLFIDGASLIIQDEQGNAVEPWPRMPGTVVGGRGEGPLGWAQHALAPGKSISQLVTFQIPYWEQSQGHRYQAHASSSLSRADIQHPDRSDRVTVSIETGRIPLRISQPRPDQHLKIEWHADLKSYTLRVSDGNGRPITGPAWGGMEVTSTRGMSSGPMQDSPDGNWSAPWVEYLVRDVKSLQVRAWVGARGYVVATVTDEVKGAAP